MGAWATIGLTLARTSIMVSATIGTMGRVRTETGSSAMTGDGVTVEGVTESGDGVGETVENPSGFEVGIADGA